MKKLYTGVDTAAQAISESWNQTIILTVFFARIAQFFAILPDG